MTIYKQKHKIEHLRLASGITVSLMPTTEGRYRVAVDREHLGEFANRRAALDAAIMWLEGAK